MSLVTNNKIETIEIPADYKNLFLKIVDNFSVWEAEKRFYVNEEDYVFFFRGTRKRTCLIK